MSYGFPDWMFAAIAIAAYEIAAWVRHRFAAPWAMYVAYGVIIVCALILGVRYLVRAIRKRRHGDDTGSEDWRDF